MVQEEAHMGLRVRPVWLAGPWAGSARGKRWGDRGMRNLDGGELAGICLVSSRSLYDSL